MFTAALTSSLTSSASVLPRNIGFMHRFASDGENLQCDGVSRGRAKQTDLSFSFYNDHLCLAFFFLFS